MINIDGTIWLWKIQNWYKVSLYHLFSIIKAEKAKSCGHLAIFGHDFQNEAIWNNILKNASKIIFIKEKGFCKRYILEWYFLHYLPTYYITYTQCTHSWLLQYPLAEIKPCGLGSRIWYVEAFWYKTEFKIIYFVKLCLIVLIVSDCLPWIYFLSTYNKFRVRVNHPIGHNQRTKKWPHFFFWGWRLIFFSFK